MFTHWRAIARIRGLAGVARTLLRFPFIGA
jgi:hypothetical protein